MSQMVLSKQDVIGYGDTGDDKTARNYDHA